MPTWLQVIIGSGVGGGVGAGLVTFALNFWKGERETRRANLERLYRAAHKYINEMLLVVLEVRQHRFDATKVRSDIVAQVEEINVLIDLHFPRLRETFERYRAKNEAFIVDEDTATFRRDPTDFEKDALQIIQEGNNFREEIARLMHELEVYLPG